MKKFILLPFQILFLSTISLGQQDQNIQLSYEEFVEIYAVDDTSLALIDLYFDKHDVTAIGKLSILPLSTAITIASPPVGLGLMVVSSPLFVSGIVTKRKYSRRNLLKTLYNYHNYHELNKSNIRKIKPIIKFQDEDLKERLAANNLLNLKEIRNNIVAPNELSSSRLKKHFTVK